LIVFLLTLLLPFAVAKALNLVIYIGKSLLLTDRDFLHFFNVVTIYCTCGYQRINHPLLDVMDTDILKTRGFAKDGMLMMLALDASDTAVRDNIYLDDEYALSSETDSSGTSNVFQGYTDVGEVESYVFSSDSESSVEVPVSISLSSVTSTSSNLVSEMSLSVSSSNRTHTNANFYGGISSSLVLSASDSTVWALHHNILDELEGNSDTLSFALSSNNSEDML
jgi:hypothetical protein